MNPQSLVDNCFGAMAHLAGAHRMEDRGTVAAHELQHVLLALHPWPRVVFLGDVSGHGRGRSQLAGQLETANHGLSILRCSQIVRLDPRCVLRALRADAQLAAAGRAQLANRHCEAGPFMRLAGGHVRAERAEVELHVRRRFFRSGLGEHAALLDAYRQWPPAEKSPLHAD
ncbi:hypothetical protein D3C80_1602230 [compost metagenome]